MTFNNAFKDIISNIEENGTVEQPRDLKVKELTVQQFVFDSNSPFADFENRSFNFKYFAGELVWYLNQDRDVKYISNFSKFWSHITNPYTNEINSNYGSLLFGEQLEWVTKSLMLDKNTRQAIAFLNQPKFQFAGNKDFVCTMYLNFWIRDNKLHMKVQMRSNDIFYGLTFDAPFFSFVHQHVRLWLLQKYPELELGDYHHCVDNIHFYERHFDLANNILSESDNQGIEYTFELTEPLFEIDDLEHNMVLTDHGNNFIEAVNQALENDSEKSEYYNILSEYLNIKKI
jgi:thymidylate synthase